MHAAIPYSFVCRWSHPAGKNREVHGCQQGAYFLGGQPSAAPPRNGLLTDFSCQRKIEVIEVRDHADGLCTPFDIGSGFTKYVGWRLRKAIGGNGFVIGHKGPVMPGIKGAFQLFIWK